MTIDWTKSQALERLFVVLLATHDQAKYDYAKMAEMFGEGTTNHSIKGHFAKFKKRIPALGNPNEGAISAPSTPNQKKRANRKPKKNEDPGLVCGKILKGRVEKTRRGIKDEDAGSEDGNDF